MAFDISLVTLGVEDLEASIAFYTDLGLPLRDRESDDEIAFFTLDGAWLALYPRELLAEDATVPPGGEGFAGVTLAHNVGSEAAVDALVEDAVAAGAEVVKPPRTGVATRATSRTRTATAGRSRTTRSWTSTDEDRQASP